VPRGFRVWSGIDGSGDHGEIVPLLPADFRIGLS
jgi:hypothetical protein